MCIIFEELRMKNKLNKFWVILGTLMALLIPIIFLFGIVNDRISYKKEAESSISQSWAGSQIIGMPLMSVKLGKTNKNFMLKDYIVEIEVNPEVRKKGIFKVPVYTADVDLKGAFTRDTELNNALVALSFYVTDVKGLTELPEFRILNQPFVKSYEKSITKTLTTSASEIPFEIKYKVRGMNDIYVIPRGQFNKVKISGNWANPSFTGDFLPSFRKVDADGFNAEWSVPKLATTSNLKLGVSLLLPVDNYKMATRALKYAFLFLSLTFLAYFLFEITSKNEEKIHPLQYLMIGGSLLIFYLLLVAISEFTSFFAAYFVAALMTISLIYLYTRYVLIKNCSGTYSGIIAGILIVLYTFLYTLLQLQDFSLIIGSFGLFAAVAAAMFITKDVKWYDDEKS